MVLSSDANIKEKEKRANELGAARLRRTGHFVKGFFVRAQRPPALIFRSLETGMNRSFPNFSSSGRKERDDVPRHPRASVRFWLVPTQRGRNCLTHLVSCRTSVRVLGRKIFLDDGGVVQPSTQEESIIQTGATSSTRTPYYTLIHRYHHHL